MMMGRKDYEVIAKVIKDRRDNAAFLGLLGWTDKEVKLATDVIDDLARFLAAALAETKPHFNFKRFYKDCGLES